MRNSVLSGRGEPSTLFNGFQSSRSYWVNPTRETLLHNPGAFRLTIPPNALYDDLGLPIKGRAEMKVQVVDRLYELFTRGLHTWAQGQWMGFYKGFQVEHVGGENLFLAPLTLDIPEPREKRTKVLTRFFQWKDFSNNSSHPSSWKLRTEIPSSRYRYLGKSYFRTLIEEPNWLGLLYNLGKGLSKCMLTVRLTQNLSPQKVRMFVRLHGQPCFGPVHFHNDRWGVTGLPGGYAATFFAFGKEDSTWYFGQQTVEQTNNQRLTLSMETVEKSEVGKWIQQILE